MEVIVKVLAYLTLFLNVAIIGSLLYFVGKKAGYDLAKYSIVERLKQVIGSYNRETALLIALTATLGSLYLSNIKGWSPCRLCWFQRIFMYPLVILIGAGIFTKDKDLKDYVLPVAIIGSPIAFIHSLIQRYDQFSSAGCSITEISCSTEFTFHFGYITIPVMAFTAFIAIIILIWRFDQTGTD